MKRSLLFALILLSGGLIFGQQYSFSSFSLEEGLAQSQVRSMTSDSQGNIWVGTLGGVSRFDGREFENYTKFSGLFDDHANTIIELSDKSIAVGSVGGVSIINAEGIKNFPLEENFKNTFVNHLLELKDGSLLVSTYDGVFKLKNGQFQLIPDCRSRSRCPG